MPWLRFAEDDFFAILRLCFKTPLLERARSEIGQRVNVLGVSVSVLNLTTALEAISRAVTERRKGYVCVTGVQAVSEAQDDPDFRRVLNGVFLNTPDGMLMV